jgi:hypothetical protein
LSSPWSKPGDVTSISDQFFVATDKEKGKIPEFDGVAGRGNKKGGLV